MLKSIFNWLFNPCQHDFKVIDERTKPDYYTDSAGYVHNYQIKSSVLLCSKCGKVKIV